MRADELQVLRSKARAAFNWSSERLWAARWTQRRGYRVRSFWPASRL